MEAKRLRIVALVLIVPILFSMLAVEAFAASKFVASRKTIVISSIADLEAAITGQQDGQTWVIRKGRYDLTPNQTIEVGGQKGWYFPIVADNLTIIGQGDPVIYSSFFTPNGNWASQDLICVFGNNCSISGLTLMPKTEVNKTLEVVGDINFTIKDCSFVPNPLVPEDGGCLYINGAEADGKNVIRIYDNYFDYSLIALDGVSARSVQIVGNTFRHLFANAYAIGNTFWGSADRLTLQYCDVYVSGNNFRDVAPGQCIIKARLNQTFILDTKNRVNGKKIRSKDFQQYVVLGNVVGSRYENCKNAEVIVGRRRHGLK